jgi:hypothetical protein
MRLPPERQMGWAEWAQIWSQTSAPGTDAAIGEARLFLARAAAGGIGAVPATATLGHSLDPLLPYREDRAREWWRRGTTTSAGYAVWDTRPGDTDSVREILIIAASGRDAELSAWAWSDGTADFPPFARYLLHAAKLRYEARLFDSWERDQRGGDIDGMLAELSVALAADAPHPGKAELLRSGSAGSGRRKSVSTRSKQICRPSATQSPSRAATSPTRAVPTPAKALPACSPRIWRWRGG